MQIYGSFKLIRLPDHPDVVAYTRTLEEEEWLFIGNFGRTSVPLDMEKISKHRNAELVCSTLDNGDSQDLRQLEARLYRLS